MANQFVSGYYTFTYTPQPCSSRDCAAAPTSTVPTTTFWLCAPCTKARNLKSLANTLEECDRMRATVAARFRVSACDVVVPKWNKEIMDRFKKLGGKVKCVRAVCNKKQNG